MPESIAIILDCHKSS